MSDQGWRTIDSAPKDGTWIIAWDGSKVAPASWTDDTGDFGSGDIGWCYGDTHWGGVLYEGINLMVAQPTHWQPLPPPPPTTGDNPHV